MPESLDRLSARIKACRICLEAPKGRPLPHEPRPVFQVSSKARLLIVGQAPGTRVHASGRPFTDPSGVRLRQWLGIDETLFYDERHVAIVPMGFCFPGQNAKGADLPPRRECAPAWRAKLLAHLNRVAFDHLSWPPGPDLASGRSRRRRFDGRGAELAAGLGIGSEGSGVASSVLAQQCLAEEESLVCRGTPAGSAPGSSGSIPACVVTLRA